MQPFLKTWADAATTSLGLFWMAFWAFGLGYLISSMIQVFVTRERMKRQMGESGAKSVGLGAFFGFISSSCSFAALSTTRALLIKGAGLIPALAFLLASTNLVIELGIIIALFLSWQFVVAEYVGGLLLIVLMWIVVKVSRPSNIIEEGIQKARAQSEGHEGHGEDEELPDWRERITSREGWCQVARRYFTEWQMVWKDVTIGFTVAGIIAAFVPPSFFEALFLGSAVEQPAFWQVLLHTLIGPVAAFFTFIGSMGNIPLAAVLFANGVSFAGVIAFIFSDLVVFPVLRIQAKYYGWKMALYILGVFLLVLVGSAIAMHYGFSLAGMLPDASQVKQIIDREFFALDYSFFLNLAFLALSAGFFAWKLKSDEDDGDHDHGETSIVEQALSWLAALSYLWLAVGLALEFFG